MEQLYAAAKRTWRTSYLGDTLPKKLLLILLCSPGLLAMTQVKQSSRLKLELSDGTEVEVPRHLAELSETIHGTLELIDEDTPISLPQLSKEDWELVYEQLALAYGVATEKTVGARQALLASLRKLSADELLSCMLIVDYLGVPGVFETCLELAYGGHLNTLSYDQLSQLQPKHVNEIIFRKACALYGPYEAILCAICRGKTAGDSAVCVTPDDKIVAGSDDGTVRVWDSEGNQLAVCEGHEGPIYTLCITPDGKIISGSLDQTVRVWDTEGNQLAVCEGQENLVRAFCIARDGKIIAGPRDRTVRIWDSGGYQLAACKGHEGAVNALCITPDGKIVSGSDDKTVRIWDSEGHQLAVCKGHTSLIVAVCITPDGKIISGSLDKTVRVWDTEGNQLAVCEGHEGPIYQLCITPDGRIVSRSDDETVRVWDSEGHELAICVGHKDTITAVCVAPDGKIVSGSDDGTVRVWDIMGNQLAVCRGNESKITYCRSVCVTRDGTIISRSENIDRCSGIEVWDATVSLTDVQAEKVWLYLLENTARKKTERDGWNYIKHIIEVDEFPTNKKAEHARQTLVTYLRNLSADELLSCLIAAYSSEQATFEASLELAFAGHLSAFSYEQLSQLQRSYVQEIIFRRACALYGPYDTKPLVSASYRDYYNSVCVTHDDTIVFCMFDLTIGVFDTDGNKRVSFEGPKNGISALCVAPDGKIISGSHDGTVQVVDLENMKSVVCQGHEDTVSALCITPDGRIVSGSDDGTIRVWDIEDIKCVAVCVGHKDAVTAVCVAPDGKIVSGSKDKTVILWDMKGIDENVFCIGHKGGVLDVCVAPDGKIVSRSEDGTVRIWDTKGNELICRKGTAMCLSPDGTIVSGSSDGAVRIWDTEGNQLAVCQGPSNSISAVCVTHDGKVVSGSKNGVLVVWDKQGNRLAICKGYEDSVDALFTTHNGYGVLSGGKFEVLNMTLRLTDTQVKKVWVYLQENPERETIEQNGWDHIKLILEEYQELPLNEKE